MICHNFYYEKIGNKTTCIQDEIHFEIPDSWEWCRLENIGNTNIGLTYSPDDISDTGIIVLRSSNIKNGRLIFDDLVKVNKAIKLTQYVQINDIIICARNGSKSLVGKCAIIDSSEPMTFGAFMAIFRTLIYEYVYYYFNSTFFRSYFENDDNKQINQVTQEILKKSLIPVPPFKEQQRIVELLKGSFEQFELISENLQKIRLYKSFIKLKILDIYFGEDSSYKSYYENEYSLGELLQYEQPGPFIVKSTEYNDSYKTPVLTPGKSFILGYTNETDGVYKVNAKKVIIFDDFTTASRLIDFDFKVKSSAMKILTNRNDKKFNTIYLYYLLKTIYVNNDTHKRYWISEYAPIKLKVHTYDEQNKIVSDISKINDILDSI